MRYQDGLELIQQAAPHFTGVNKQPARVIGRHMDLGEACIKWALFLLNLAVSFSGLGLICLGLYFELSASDYKDFLGSTLSVSWALVGIGLSLTLVGGCGCCGANKSSPLFLIMYSLFVLAAIFGQVVAVLVWLTNRDEVEAEVTKILFDKVALYGGTNNTINATEPIDFIHQALECCGVVNGSVDWTKDAGLAPFWIADKSNSGTDVPDSCCIEEKEDCGENAFNSSLVFKEGCKTVLFDFIDGNMSLLGGVIAGFLGVQLFSACGACFLTRAIQQHFAY